MVYGKYCPMCRQPFYSVQRGSGVISTLGDVAKRAMARELGKKNGSRNDESSAIW